MATFPKDDIKKILDSLCKTNFEKVRDKNTFLMGIVRRVRREATGQEKSHLFIYGFMFPDIQSYLHAHFVDPILVFPDTLPKTSPLPGVPELLQIAWQSLRWYVASECDEG